MKAALVGVIVVLISVQIQPFTADTGDSDVQLLKLREVLEHINSNLEKKDEARTRTKKSFSVGDLDKFKEQLSSEDQARLKHLQSKLKYLKAALQEKVSAPNPGDDDKGGNKRSDLLDDSDGKLKQFEEELSSNDQALIQRMRSKLKFLNAALAQEQGNNPGDTDEEIEKTPDKRDEEELSPDILADFSPEIQALLKKHPSQIKYMKTALEHKDANPGDEGPEETEANEDTKREQPESSDLNKFIDGLSAKDAAVAKKLKSKLQYLKLALQEEKTNPNGVDERCLSGRCNCREGRCEDDDSKDKVDERCLSGRCECRDGRCEDEDQSKVLHDTERKLISDVREAKAKGVDLRSLLRALHSRAARRSIDEENELENLRNGGA